jgi:hypothetical protein
MIIFISAKKRQVVVKVLVAEVADAIKSQKDANKH